MNNQENSGAFLSRKHLEPKATFLDENGQRQTVEAAGGYLAMIQKLSQMGGKARAEMIQKLKDDAELAQCVPVRKPIFLAIGLVYPYVSPFKLQLRELGERVHANAERRKRDRISLFRELSQTFGATHAHNLMTMRPGLPINPPSVSL